MPCNFIGVYCSALYASVYYFEFCFPDLRFKRITSIVGKQFRLSFIICDCIVIIGAGVFRRVRKFAKNKLLASSCLYVCTYVRPPTHPPARPSAHPHGTTRPTLDGFSWHSTFHYFSKMCRENSTFIKIRQVEPLIYVKVNVEFWSYLLSS
jgi:hypothetical protein